MSRSCRALIMLLIAASAAATTSSNYAQGRGCELIVPQSVEEHREPVQEPLRINVGLIILGIRDVPTSGGSLTVEL